MADAAKQQRLFAKPMLLQTMNSLIKGMENEGDVELIKSRFNDLKIWWNVVPDLRQKYIQTILDNVEDASVLHERDTERRAEQQKMEEEQNKSNIQSLKCMRNIMGILFRKDAYTLLNLIKSTEEFKTANLVKQWNKYLKNQLDQCFKAQQL